MNELVSIIVPCYNQAQYLPEALQSVLDQTYIDWECIIVNDGSPDETDKVSKEWLDKDSRFKYIYKENAGLSSARNAGIEMAEGEFILPLDADDSIGNNYLFLVTNEFKKNRSIRLVYALAEQFGEKSGEWKLENFSLNKLARANMIYCSAIYRKEDWQIVGGYDTNLKYGLEDWEFWIAILKKGATVLRINYVGFYYRIKKESMVQQLINSTEKKDFSFKYISIKHADFFINELGSFNDFLEREELLQKDWDRKMKSKKFTINAFTKLFFGFRIFRLT